MIIARFCHRESGAEARLYVDDNGEHTIEGDVELVNIDRRLVIPTGAVGGFDAVRFETEPARWARSAHRASTREVMVEVIHDDAPQCAEAAPSDPGRRLTRSQAAQLADMKPDSFGAHVSRGRAPAPVERVGRTPLWDAKEVAAWVRGRRKNAEAAPAEERTGAAEPAASNEGREHTHTPTPAPRAYGDAAPTPSTPQPPQTPEPPYNVSL